MSRLRMRGGFAGGESAPPDYGPTNGKDWVIANVGPRFVSKPAGAIEISPPGGLTQAVLDAAASDAVFWLLPGTHTSIRGSWDSGLIPKSGQTIVAPSDGSCIIDGGGWASGVGYGAQSPGNVTNVTIRGGKWTNYGWIGAAYGWHSPFHVGPGWVVEDADVTGNHDSGTHKGGNNNLHGLVIRHCNFTGNGRYGSAFGGQSVGDPALNVIFEHNYLYNNNTYHYDPGDDAGGSKWGAIGTGSVWRYNYFAWNYGFDCWFDTACMDVDVTDNVFIKNRTSGNLWWAPFHWEDNGPGWFRRNYMEMTNDGSAFPGGLENAGVRIVAADAQRYSISTKKEYEVSYNWLVTEDLPVVALWAQCWQNPDLTWSYRVPPRSNWVHHNDVYFGMLGGGNFGGITSQGWVWGDWYQPSYDNRFWANRYHVQSMSTSYWCWGMPPGQNNRTWAQWQGYGFDTDGERL